MSLCQDLMFVMLNVIYAECLKADCHDAKFLNSECHYSDYCNAECHYAERHYAECRGAIKMHLMNCQNFR
jgi:hypothetical protein